MKFFKSKFLGLLLVISGITACSVDDGDEYCFYQQNTSTTTVTGPETALVNEEITFDVSFKIANDCGSFSGFNQSEGYPKQVVAVVGYNGCNCNEQVTTVTKEYNFTAATPGEYELRFLTTDFYISKFITVTEE